MADYFYTWSSQSAGSGIPIVGGEGIFFDCADGSRWTDLGSLSYQASLGHGHPEVVEAVREQASSLCLAPPNAEFEAKSEVARMLLELAPEGYSKVFFTLGGAEATENAMKMARMSTGRLKFMSRYRSYHGATMGALALTGDYRRPPLEPALGGVVHILGSDPVYLEEVMELEGPGTIAAVFMEPVPGANGVLLPREDYWPRMRRACDEHGTLLVADEVLTGFGRLGKAFGHECFNGQPDLITTAKALTGGYAPMGAVLVHERVASHFDESVLYAGLTNYAHPLGCAAALACLRIYERDGLYERGAELEGALLAHLESWQDRFPGVVSGARGKGLLAAVDLRGNGDFWSRLQAEVRKRTLFLHLSQQRGSAIFAPPLIISEVELDEGLGRFGEALEAALGE